MADEHNSIWHWLESAGLERFYNKFRAMGITESSFVNLQFSDYDNVGVTMPQDRQRLFKLIQVVKRELKSSGAPARSSAPASSLSPPARTGIPVSNNSSDSKLARPKRHIKTRSGIMPPGAISGVHSPKVSARKRGQRPAALGRVGSEATLQTGARLGMARPKTPGVPRRRSTQGNRNPPAVAQDDMGSRRSSRNAGVPDSPPDFGTFELAQMPDFLVADSLNTDRSHRAQSAAPNSGRGDASRADSRRARSQNSASASSIESKDEDVKDAFGGSKIRVVVRKRPLSKKEMKKSERDIITFSKRDRSTIHVHEHKVKVDLTKYVEKHRFVFDEVFHSKASNAEIYVRTCKPLVSFFVKNQGKVACFAYGQTGAGKTFTMMGPDKPGSRIKGLYAYSARDIFEMLRASNSNLEVWVSFFEIYGGKLFDLLNGRKKLVCREDSKREVNIVGLREMKVEDTDELFNFMAIGNACRSTGSTGANDSSSRSHAIMQIRLKTPSGRKKRDKAQVMGKFSFIDLAGSERGADTMSNNKKTRIEGAEINRSLLALKECIRALDQDAHHLPFRGSKLTQVLKDSFIGNSRTIMIANVAPSESSCEHTLNTLRYADRVKELGGGGRGGRGKNAYMPHRRDEKTSTRVDEDEYDSASDEFEEDDEESEPRVVPPPTQARRETSNRSTDSRETRAQTGRQRSRKSRVPRGGSNNSSNNSNSSVPRSRSNQSNQSSRSNALEERRKTVAAIDTHVDEREQTQDLLRTHQQICAAILEEEDQIVECHRRQIDDTMKLVKEELKLLKQFDAVTFNVDQYVDMLDGILTQKLNSINDLRERIAVFRAHLKEEELVSSSLQGFGLGNAAPPSTKRIDSALLTDNVDLSDVQGLASPTDFSD